MPPSNSFLDANTQLGLTLGSSGSHHRHIGSLEFRIGGQSKIDYIVIYVSQNPMNTQTKIVLHASKQLNLLTNRKAHFLNVSIRHWGSWIISLRTTLIRRHMKYRDMPLAAEVTERQMY